MAQSRSFLHTLGPKVGTVYALGALGIEIELITVGGIFHGLKLLEAPESLGRNSYDSIWVVVKSMVPFWVP